MFRRQRNRMFTVADKLPKPQRHASYVLPPPIKPYDPPELKDERHIKHTLLRHDMLLSQCGRYVRVVDIFTGREDEECCARCISEMMARMVQ